ncbi:MAG: PD-(D/E)XK nuclease family protein [Halioglobus sp.]
MPQEFDLAQGLYDISSLEALIEEGFILLTPNQRLARRIKAQWDAQRLAAGAKVWKPLPVHAVEDWLLQQWDVAASKQLVAQVTPLGYAQILEVWRQVITTHSDDNADYHLLRTESIAEIADHARELLLRWQVDTRLSKVQQLFHFERDCGTFMQWLKMFAQRLEAAELCTPTDCLVQLANVTGLVPVSRVALVEFDQIAPLVRAALSAVTLQWLEVVPTHTHGERLLHTFSSKRAELQALASWVVCQHRVSPTTTIGIVLSNGNSDRASLEYLLRREFDCLGENYNSLPVNFSSGVALLHVPLVRDAFAALATGLEEITVSAVVHLLHSRFLISADTQHVVTQSFVKALYSHGRERLSVSTVCDLAGEASMRSAIDFVLHRQLRAMSRMLTRRRKALPSAWVAQFNEILSLWGWSGEDSLDSLEYQQLDLWLRTLDEFSALDAVCRPMDFAQALALLRDCCARQVFQPQTADSPIQVLGPLEAAGLSFDHLWVCGMQATTWPSAAQPNPFIPVAIQTQFAMPHANSERELAFSSGLIDQYARKSGTLHASYCRQLDGIPELPSALITEFKLQVIAEPTAVAMQWISSSREAALVAIEDRQAPPLQREDGNLHAGGSSLLEHQSQCPFRAFATHRLQLSPLPDFYTGLSAAERGALLHAVLAAIWEQLGDSATLLKLTASQQEQAVVAAIDFAIKDLTTRQLGRQGKAFWSLEKERLARLLHEWLAVKRLREPFTVIATESELELQLATLKIRLRADRIDQLGDSSHMVIDYKSGATNIRDWLGERPANPQLPLYALAQQDTVSVLAFAQVRARQCRYTGLGSVVAAAGISTEIALSQKTGSVDQDWKNLKKSWRRILEGLANEFIVGEARVDPHTPSVCTACGLQALCRIDTASINEPEQTE